MSEQDRSRLYDWWCEHADESLAEYAMSCLSPVPLPDLATKDDFARFETATKDDFARLDLRVDKLDAKFDKLDARVDKLDTKVAKLDIKFVQLDTKVDLLASQHRSDREEDRRTARVRHYWLAGMALSILASVWLSAAGVVG